MALDIEKLKKAQQELQTRMTRGGGPSMKFWKPKEGINKIRILPGWADEGAFAGQFWREVHQHWNLSENSGPVLCPKKTPFASDDKECPVCDLVDSLREKKGDVAAQELARDLRAKVAYLLSVVDLSDAVYTAKDTAEWAKERPDSECPFEVGDPKVQCYAATSTISEQIFNIVMSNNLDITDREVGHNIILTKIGNKDRLKTRYTLTPDVNKTKAPVPSNFQSPDLSKIGAVKKYDDLMKLLAEGPAAALVDALPSGGAQAALTSGDTNASWGMGTDSGDLAEQMRKQLG